MRQVVIEILECSPIQMTKMAAGCTGPRAGAEGDHGEDRVCVWGGITGTFLVVLTQSD